MKPVNVSSSTPSDPLLRVDQLRKSFGAVQAVDSVSFELRAGELLALIGPNGAGKSTCFNLINGQLKPDSGQVILGGKPITGASPEVIFKQGIGRTFQIAATFSSMTTIENVQLALISHHEGFNIPDLLTSSRLMHRRVEHWYKDEAYELLSLVDMQDQAQRPASILAYGDVKRLELAIALANQPRVLLMDEPTAGMASQERLALMDITRRLARDRQIGVLFTEHSMDAVFHFADRVLVLARGQLIAQGTVQEIRSDRQVQAVYLGEESEADPGEGLN